MSLMYIKKLSPLLDPFRSMLHFGTDQGNMVEVRMLLMGWFTYVQLEKLKKGGRGD